MSIIFRKRPDHIVSTPEAKEPHLDLHSIDARQGEPVDDDDIPVLLPAEPAEVVRHTLNTPTPNRSAAATGAPPARLDRTLPNRNAPDPFVPHRVIPDRTTPAETADRAAPILKRETVAVHIPPPPPAPHHSPTRTVSHTSSPATEQTTARATHATHAAAQTPAGTAPSALHSVSEATQQRPPQTRSPAAATSELPGHPTTQDYAPFLNTAKNRQDPHNKPELYVWSDDENDAFAQAARRDFTLNRIEPTAGRPSFDASLFRAPSRPDALACAITPVSVDDPATAMQAEIDALVTELLDESHDYLKQRLLEEIPEIIAKYRRS